MNKEKCKHEKWNPCGNNFYSCSKCGILRTSQQINIYAEKDQQIAELKAENERLRKQQSIDDDLIEMQSSRLNNQEQQLKDNTKRVCEKIRNGYPNFDNLDKFDWQGFEEFLDQIEKGENK